MQPAFSLAVHLSRILLPLANKRGNHEVYGRTFLDPWGEQEEEELKVAAAATGEFRQKSISPVCTFTVLLLLLLLLLRVCFVTRCKSYLACV